jgi:hypothetical protein
VDAVLVDGGDPDAAVGYIDAITRERGAELTLTVGSALPRVDAQLSTDLVTVLAKLIDNVLDTVGGVGGGVAVRLVDVDLREVELPTAELPAESAVRVTVRDTGQASAPT